MNENSNTMKNEKYHRSSSRGLRIIFMFLGGIILAVFFALIFGWFVELLWNWLMPNLFNLKAITYWQAVGVVLLAKLIFGGFGRPHRPWPDHPKFPYPWRPRIRARDEWDWQDENWKPGGSYRYWRYYDDYWKEEGKQAFEAYLERTGRIQKMES
jgi:MFS family permease